MNDRLEDIVDKILEETKLPEGGWERQRGYTPEKIRSPIKRPPHPPSPPPPPPPPPKKSDREK